MTCTSRHTRVMENMKAYTISVAVMRREVVDKSIQINSREDKSTRVADRICNDRGRNHC